MGDGHLFFPPPHIYENIRGFCGGRRIYVNVYGGGGPRERAPRDNEGGGGGVFFPKKKNQKKKIDVNIWFWFCKAGTHPHHGKIRLIFHPPFRGYTHEKPKKNRNQGWFLRPHSGRKFFFGRGELLPWAFLLVSLYRCPRGGEFVC